MNTTTLLIASVGGLLWLVATLRERFGRPDDGLWSRISKWFKKSGNFAKIDEPPEKTEQDAAGITVESLENELGITPDAYLCDRISRIHDALLARKNGTKTRKGSSK